ncbi:hypothetical protein CDCA_CDCA08G2369 [Cyanidium caldarium]|uniref:DNA 3'-5' helicase n=1 Tax=Cyanidium caldarium TaxID=2771 RepID=A0AAV9IW38_CYACA|nr:hypothetical protein CDCA_CDCA08G2369 [Cyanidium caldarium]
MDTNTTVQALCAGLSAAQVAAVRAPLDRPLLLVACPGAGKTRTLVTRMAYLVAAERLPAERALLVTFSRTAVEEAKERLLQLSRTPGMPPALSRALLQCRVRTLHGLGRELLRAASFGEWERVCGRVPVPRRVEAAERLAIIREAMELCEQQGTNTGAGANGGRESERSVLEMIAATAAAANTDDARIANNEFSETVDLTDERGNTERRRAVLQMSHDIAERKAALVAPVDVSTLSPEARARLHLNDIVYAYYERWLQQLNCIDYDDMIAMPRKLLGASAPVRQRLQRGVAALFVDEFQDTSTAQLRLLQAILRHTGAHLCAAGDDDQSIYGWRNAQPAFMTEFHTHFPNPHRIFLTCNHRSTGQIVRCSDGLIRHNRQRIRKAMVLPEDAPADGGEPVRVHRYATAADEDADLARQLQQLHQQHGARWRDMAVLCRLSKPLEAVRAALQARDIPLAGADQAKTVARSAAVDAALRIDDQRRESAWAAAAASARPVLALIELLVNERDVKMMSCACAAFAPEMHALTRACIAREAQRAGGEALMQTVRRMIRHPERYFRPPRGVRGVAEEEAAAHGGLSMRLAPNQLSACKALAQAYEALRAHAREHGARISLSQLVAAAQDVARRAPHQQRHRHGDSEYGGRALRNLCQNVEREVATAALEQIDEEGVGGGDDAALFRGLMRVAHPPTAPTTAFQNATLAANLPADDRRHWLLPLSAMLHKLHQVLQDGPAALHRTRRREAVDAVAVSTIHNAKGKQWRYVFVVRLVEGICPLSVWFGEIEEERRLLYVAMTRAMHRCTLSAAYEEETGDSTESNQPSRFLAELKAAHCVLEQRRKGVVESEERRLAAQAARKPKRLRCQAAAPTS